MSVEALRSDGEVFDEIASRYADEVPDRQYKKLDADEEEVFDNIVAHYDDEPSNRPKAQTADRDDEASRISMGWLPGKGVSGMDRTITDPIAKPANVHSVASSTPPAAPATSPQPAAKPHEIHELSVAIVGQDHDALKRSMEASTHKINNEIANAKGAKKIALMFLKGGVANPYFRQRYIWQKHEEAKKANDSLYHIAEDESARFAAHQYEAMYFAQQKTKAQLDEGEHQDRLEDDSKLRLEIVDILNTVVASNFKLDNDMIEARYRKAVSDNQKEVLGGNDFTISNLLTTIDQLKEMHERNNDVKDHQDSLMEAIKSMPVYVAESRSAGVTEAHYQKIDRAAQFFAKKKMLSFTSVTTVATVLATGAILANVTKGTIGAAAHIAAPVLAVGFGVYKGAVRSQRKIDEARLDQEFERRPSETADTEPRFKFQKLFKDRFALKDTLYNAKPATTGIELLNEIYKDPDEKIDSDDDQFRTQFNEAVETFAEWSARQEIKRSRGIALITNDELHVKQLRDQLEISTIKASTRLSQVFVANRNKLKLDDGQLPDDMDFESYVEAMHYHEQQEALLNKDIEDANKAARRRKLGFAALGGTVGLAASGASIAAGALIHSFEGTSAGAASVDANATHSTAAPNVEINGEYSVMRAGDTYTILDGKGAIMTPDGLHIGPNGELDDHAKETLKNLGISYEHRGALGDLQPPPTETQPSPVSVHDYMHTHGRPGENTLGVTSRTYLDNNTLRADGNELGTQWLGNGVGPDGSYQLDISHMKSMSFHGGDYASPAEAARQGGLIALISPDKASDGAPFYVKIDESMHIVVDKNNPAFNLFSIDKNGHAQFDGYHIEVAAIQHLSADRASGDMQIVSTVTGHDVFSHDGATIMDSTPTPSGTGGPQLATVGHDKFVVSGSGNSGVMSPESSSWNYDAAYAIAIEKTLSPAERGFRGETRNQRQEQAAARLELYEKERMPEFKKDPNAKVNLGDAVDWYSKLLTKNNPEYAKTIDIVGDSSDSGSPDKTSSKRLNLAAKLGNTIDGVRIKSINALSSEAKDITKVLETMAAQENAVNVTTLLHLHWPESAKQSPDKGAEIEAVKEQVRQFGLDRFPLTVMASGWDDNDIARDFGGNSQNYADRKATDFVILSAKQAIESGNRQRDKDLALLSWNDTISSIEPNHDQIMMQAFKDNSDRDVFTAEVRFSKRQSRVKGLNVAKEFFDLAQKQAARSNITTPPITAGSNTAIRLSTGAALGMYGMGRVSDEQANKSIITERIAAARSGGGSLRTRLSNRAYVMRKRLPKTYLDAREFKKTVNKGANTRIDISSFERGYMSGQPFTSMLTGKQDSTGVSGPTQDDFVGRPDESWRLLKNALDDIANQYLGGEGEVVNKVAMEFFGTGRDMYRIEHGNGNASIVLTPAGEKWILENKIERQKSKPRKTVSPKNTGTGGSNPIGAAPPGASASGRTDNGDAGGTTKKGRRKLGFIPIWLRKKP